MNPQNATAFPNWEAPNYHHQQKQMTTFPAESEKQESSDAPSRRYQRRSSVTSYSLEQTAPSTRQASTELKMQDISLDPETTPIARSDAPVPHRRYGRRNSVTRCILENIVPVTETKSLSPVPLARRASFRNVSVDNVGEEELQHQINANQEKQPIIEQTQEPPRGRYRRRCSVTQYCLEDVPKVSTIVKATVEEPADTVDSSEHSKMLANDTIESAVAGDLITGWNRAGTDYLESDGEGNRGDGELICGFGKRLGSSERRASMSALEPETGNYFLGVLSKRFSNAPFWLKTLTTEVFKTLESEVNSGNKIMPGELLIDVHSAVEQASAIEIPSPTL